MMFSARKPRSSGRGGAHAPKGQQKLQALRAQDLLTIEAWRGGFKRRGEKYEDGSASPGRRFVLTLYAGFLRGARETPETTTTALRAMAANMRPPYPSDPPGEDPPIESIVEAEFASKTRRWGNEKLCKLLRITAAEARGLANAYHHAGFIGANRQTRI